MLRGVWNEALPGRRKRNGRTISYDTAKKEGEKVEKKTWLTPLVDDRGAATER